MASDLHLGLDSSSHGCHGPAQCKTSGGSELINSSSSSKTQSSSRKHHESFVEKGLGACALLQDGHATQDLKDVPPNLTELKNLPELLERLQRTVDSCAAPTGADWKHFEFD